MQKWAQKIFSKPLVQFGVFVVFVALGVLTHFLPLSPDGRTRWLSFLALGSSLVVWLFVAVKQWPYMEINGVPGDESYLWRVSLDGAFQVFARFRLLNRSHQTNAVLNSRYWLRVEGNPTWYPVSPTVTPDDLEGFVRQRREKDPDVFLKMPEVYPGNTAHTRYVVFCCKVPLQIEGVPPGGRLRVQFDLAEGGPEKAEVELKSSGKAPLKLERFNPF